MVTWKAKRLGIIDLGTNSVRFDVHEMTHRNHTRLLHRERLMVRLGENVFHSGRLEPDAVRRTVQALASFKRRSDELGVERLVAFGTSALRDASNSEALLQRVRRTLGIEIQVISGQAEASLIAQGVLSREKPPKGLFALVDIGGGSLEISVCEGRHVLHAQSFPLGVARLQQVFLRTIPPQDGKEAVRHLKGHINSVLEATLEAQSWPPVRSILGSSGTVRVLWRMCQRETGHDITQKWLSELIRTVTPLDLTAIRAIVDMDAKRADLILAGMVVLHQAMRTLGAGSVRATEFSLRDGILDQELRRLRPSPKKQPWDLALYIQWASRFGQSTRHLEETVQAARDLYRKLSTVHRLEDKWFGYLAIALILRNCGRVISPTGYEVHSAYVVRHAELPFEEPWEHEFVAQLCLWHNQSKSNPGKFPFQDQPPKSRAIAFVKLLALLRILDALDSAPPKHVRAQRVRVLPSKVVLDLAPGDSTDLVLLRVQQKKTLFETVFNRPLEARRLAAPRAY